MTPYLIQRAVFCDKPNHKGIDSILGFDYMGSSEFEFGALGKSLKEIRNTHEQYDYFTLEIPTNKILPKKFTVFCKTSEKDEVFNVILKLAKDQYRLKEYCDLFRYVTNDTFLPCKSDFWWDIDYHWMIWKFNDNFTTKFKKVIK